MTLDDIGLALNVHHLKWRYGNSDELMLAFKDLRLINIFAIAGDGTLKPVGALDCTKSLTEPFEIAIRDFVGSKLVTATYPTLAELSRKVREARSFAESLNSPSSSSRSRNLSLAVTHLEDAETRIEKAIAESGSSGLKSDINI